MVEWGFPLHQYYQYGYDHTIDTFTKSEINRSYQDFSINVGYKNIAPE